MTFNGMKIDFTSRVITKLLPLLELFLISSGAKTQKGKKGASSAGDSIQPVDAETQARLEALLEAAGIGKLSGETKQLTDPDVSSTAKYIHAAE